MKVMVDGFNLSLAQGTGIATYARNLTFNLKALGHEVHVLYGLRRSPDRSAIMREISFYDDVISTGIVERLVRPYRRTGELISCLLAPALGIRDSRFRSCHQSAIRCADA